jgi:hypothetical protein
MFLIQAAPGLPSWVLVILVVVALVVYVAITIALTSAHPFLGFGWVILTIGFLIVILVISVTEKVGGEEAPEAHVATPLMAPTEELVPTVPIPTSVPTLITPTPGNGRVYQGCYMSLDPQGTLPVRDVWGNTADQLLGDKPIACDQSQAGQEVPGNLIALYCTCGPGP